MNTDSQQEQNAIEQNDIRRAMDKIKHKILVLSGKGGVGKSTVAANLAVSLSTSGKKVGLLDIDLHGPSVPKIFNMEDAKPMFFENRILPISVSDNLSIMSIGFLIKDKDSPVVWRGPMKYQMIKQFLKDVEWGQLDYLIIDSPPGTGDEPLGIIQLIENAEGAVIVTTPQQVALSDVRKGITFCRTLELPIIGIVENMSGFVCQKCGEKTDIFKSGGGENLSLEMNVPFLGTIPIDPSIVSACDSGKPYIQQYSQNLAAESFRKIIEPILKLDSGLDTNLHQKGNDNMRIAIPLVQQQLSLHFGHCDEFAVFEIDKTENKIVSVEHLTPPPHEPGVLPKWLHGMGVNVIIAGGMGQRAQDMFTQNQIKVLVGAPTNTPEELVSAYLQNTLVTGDNVCDH